ncbi:hypothetical protein CLOP_g6426 [Closterium sp. NIES-67]|nr:hypothetical protein CLOP_g6426 [Closterium sp. NIES-67]
MAVVLPVGSNENLPLKVVRVIVKELRSLQDSPPEGIRVLLNDDNISTVHAEIEGPVGTPYEGGAFRMKLVLGPEFPNAPPKGFFVTRIFHPNVAKNGEICVNILKKDWKPCLGLRHVLLVVRCLLIEPYPESALNEDAGKLLLEDYEAYAKHARLFTSIHAPAAAAAATGVSMSRSKSMPQHTGTQQSQPGQQGQPGQPGQQPSCNQHILRQSVSASDHLTGAAAAAAAAAAVAAEVADSAAAAVCVSPSGLVAGGTGGSAPLAPNRSIANAEVQREEGGGGAAAGSSGGLCSGGSKGENGARVGHEKKKVDARKKSLRRL